MSDSHDSGHGAGHHGSPFIQHHYDDGQHQFDSGKLGIWFFLVQEVLFFSALFVAYILYRNHRPEIYEYCHRYLDVKWGAINTGVLIFSSLTAAWSVRCAQLGQRRGLILCLVITILCACGFLCIKYIEYAHKVKEHELFGRYFDPCNSPGEIPLLTNEDRCEGVRRSECRAGNIDQSAEPGWQVDCQVNELEGKVDKGQFVEASRTQLPTCVMEVEGDEPPKAKNPPCWEIAKNPWVCANDGVAALVHYGDDKIRWSDIKIDLQCKDAPPQSKPNWDAPLPQQSSRFGGFKPPSEEEKEKAFWAGPPPPHANMFFSIYFAMTGLHGIHVLAGIIVYMWLLRRAIRGDFTPDYFGPVDYAALYWHLVDLIWIFLFPLLYLIH